MKQKAVKIKNAFNMKRITLSKFKKLKKQEKPIFVHNYLNLKHANFTRNFRLSVHIPTVSQKLERPDNRDIWREEGYRSLH